VPPEFVELLSSPWGGLVIFCTRIVDVSMDTMRVLFIVRGKRAIAGMLGFVQALLWILAIGTALRYIDSWYHILGYAGGFAMGNIVGLTIEQAVAYGALTIQVISRRGGAEIAAGLRQRGYGVTEMEALGREGKVNVVNCVVHRGHLNDVMLLVDRFDPDAFVTVEEPKILRGGMLAAREWRIANPWTRRALMRRRQRA
jgi:uncharacterized protein YebE (UPF0316 family)